VESLSQLNNTPTRRNNILDLVITNAPDHVTEILSPEESSIFTDHHAISFDFNAFTKASRKSVRNIYVYEKGNLQGLCAALRELDLSTTITDQPEDIN
jgi:hypothetical protein